MIARRILWLGGFFLAGVAGLGATVSACGTTSATDACAVDTDCNPGRICVAHACINPLPASDAGLEAAVVDSGRDVVTVSEDAGNEAGDAGADAAACFEAGARSGVVVFGGEDVNGNPLGDTWLFDGTSWTQATADCAAPASRYSPGMAALGQKVVLFGGLGVSDVYQDTWTFDGASWTQVATGNVPGTLPDIRSAQSMATLGTTIVMCGGSGASGLGDTWTFDGTAWKEVQSPGPDSWFYDAVMAPLAGAAVLFGGYGPIDAGINVPLGGTWAFGGGSWTPIAAPSSPPARASAAMAALGNKLVLFGGAGIGEDSGLEVVLNDTWTFDGTSWTQVAEGIAPSARTGHGMATLGNVIVLYGGSDSLENDLDDTWTFDGAAWEQVTVAQPPPARDGFAMATLP